MPTGDLDKALRDGLRKGVDEAMSKLRRVAMLKAGQAVNRANRWLQEQLDKGQP